MKTRIVDLNEITGGFKTEYHSSNTVDDNIDVIVTSPMENSPTVDIALKFTQYSDIKIFKIRIFGTSEIISLLRAFEKYDEPVKVVIDNNHSISVYHHKDLLTKGSSITTYLTIQTQIYDETGKYKNIMAEAVLTIEQSREIVKALVSKIPFYSLKYSI